MKRDRKHRGVFPEDRLRAVAVVHVPVDDGDASDPAHRLCVPDSDSDVREEAEPHPQLRQRVVAGWPNEGVGVVDCALENAVNSGDRAPGCEARDLEGAVPERRLAAGIAAVTPRELADPLDVLGGVNAAQLLDGCLPRRQPNEALGHSGRIEQVLEPPLRRRALGVVARLEPATGRQLRRARPGVVPHHSLVPDKPGRPNFVLNQHKLTVLPTGPATRQEGLC